MTRQSHPVACHVHLAGLARHPDRRRAATAEGDAACGEGSERRRCAESLTPTPIPVPLFTYPPTLDPMHMHMSGKSTLLKALGGTLELREGERIVDDRLRLGLFAQDLAQELPTEVRGPDMCMCMCMCIAISPRSCHVHVHARDCGRAWAHSSRWPHSMQMPMSMPVPVPMRMHWPLSR